MANEYTIELLLTLDVDVDGMRPSVDDNWLEDIMDEVKDYIYDMDGVTISNATVRVV
jgi:hypothetical protein